MVSIKTFREFALSLEGVHEAPHFEKTSFRVKKRIFATLNEKENRATIKLSAEEQDLFCLSGYSGMLFFIITFSIYLATKKFIIA